MESGNTPSSVIHKVGDIDCSGAKPVRIVHISDTHLNHQDFIDKGLVPKGDILVHSGDFDFFRFKRHLHTEYDFHRQTSEMREFFEQLPHKHKIFVAGNHETNFPQHSVEEIQQQLPGVIYLQDSYTELEGLKIYGSPWCGRRWYSFARSFVIPYSELHQVWDNFPQDVDVLITHNPPLGILDLAVVQPWQTFWQKASFCTECKSTHDGFAHFGCGDLRAKSFELKPKLHLFGHCHERNGFLERNGILFSNAALQLSTAAHVIDFYRKPPADDVEEQEVEVVHAKPLYTKDASYCAII